MSKNDKYIPWIVVGLAGLILASLGRYIVLKNGGDTGTANLTFIIVIIGVALAYILFVELLQPLFRAGEKKIKPKYNHRPEIPEGDFKSQIDAFCHYSDEVLKGYVCAEELQLLHTYIRQYAEGNIENVTIKIKSNGLDNFDLYHYGWNIYNHFRVMKQPETADWLIAVFERLEGYDRIIYKKFRHDERATYKIPLALTIK